MKKMIKKEIIDTEVNQSNEIDNKPWYKRWYIITTIIVFFIMMIFNYNFAFILVNGDSMNPNYENGNLVFADKQYEDLYRFDVVVINSDNADQILIKRIIGLPGDTIEYVDNQLFVNGEYVEDMYGSGMTNNFKIVVEDNSYFCLGDNRENSYDSRRYGLFTKDEIIAKVQGRRYVKLGANPLY